ncbi:MAG: peptide deformylase [Verrucomicrobiota bacterium]
MVLPIVHYNDPVLRQKGAPVTVFDAALAQLGRDMVDTMQAAHGIGLAAQQIGKAMQFCVVDLREADPDDFDFELDGNRPPVELFMPMMIANPKITVLPSEKDTYEEGCLSFPDIRGDVVRPDEIEVKFEDAQGVSHVMICNGLLSRCIQHEADHLNGTLFIDRMNKRTRAAIDRAIKALAEKTKAETEARRESPPAI